MMLTMCAIRKADSSEVSSSEREYLDVSIKVKTTLFHSFPESFTRAIENGVHIAVYVALEKIGILRVAKRYGVGR